MATNISDQKVYPEVEEHLIEFRKVEKSINDEFESIFVIISNRRDELLAKLNQMELQYKKTENYYRESIEQLQASIDNLELHRFHNVLTQTIDDFRKEIDQKIKYIESVRPKLVQIDFKFDKDSLLKHIKSYGEIHEEKIRKFQYIMNKNKLPTFSFGQGGSEKGQFLSSRAVKIDEENKRILIADSGNHCIHVFDLNEDFTFVADFGRDLFKEPWGICLHNKFLFVTDHKQHSIYKFETSRLNYLSHVGRLGSGLRELNSPTSIECDPIDNLLYVADYLNNRLCVYDLELNCLKTLLEKSIQGPICLQISANHIYVLECRKPNLKRYTKTGIEEKHYFSMGTDERMQYILCFILDQEENIIAADYENNIICVYDQDGKEIWSLGESGHTAGTFTNPAGLTMAKNSALYIASSQNDCCVQIY